MKLIVQPIPNSPYFDVVDIEPALCKGARVIRAAYCSRKDAELFASAPMLADRVAELERLWVVRAWKWLARWLP